MSPSPFYFGRETPTGNGGDDEDIDAIYPNLGEGLNMLAIERPSFRPISSPAHSRPAAAAAAPTSPDDQADSDTSTDLDEDEAPHFYDPDRDVRPLSPAAAAASSSSSS